MSETELEIVTVLGVIIAAAAYSHRKHPPATTNKKI